MNKIRIFFIGLFIAVLAVPSITMPLSKNSENTEKRELASFPKFIEDGKINSDFSDGLDNYLKDHIGLRSTMVSANTKIMDNIFGVSSVENVILGNDGWLFYGNTVNDYLNIPTLSERSINNIAYSIKLVENYITENGGKFLFTSIPNKNSLYDNGMPYNYSKTDGKGNYELLYDALNKYGVTNVDITDTFKNNSEILYQKSDSHWNYKGALLGYNTILGKLEIDYNSFDGLEFESRTDWPGDLATMLYSTKAQPEEQLYPKYDFNYEITSVETKVDAITLETYNPNGNGNLVMYRDSFLNTMQVYVAESFNTTTFSRAVPYRIDLFDEKKADAVILEIVERNIANLAEKAPVMEAPKVQLDIKANTMAKDRVTVNTVESGKYLHLYGCIDENLLSKEYKAYVVGFKGDNMTCYEAFPIYEKELLESSESGDNGFSIYIPKDELLEYDSLSIMVYSDGSYHITY